MSDELFTIPAQTIRKPKSTKQFEIVEAIKKHGHITKKEAVEIVGKNIYCNADFHVGNILSNMVKKGMIKRLKPGIFTL